MSTRYTYYAEVYRNICIAIAIVWLQRHVLQALVPSIGRGQRLWGPLPVGHSPREDLRDARRCRACFHLPSGSVPRVVLTYDLVSFLARSATEDAK